MPYPHHSGDDHSEDAKLIRLGYQPQFERVLGLFGDFSLGYSYMGPMVGVFGLFTFALTTAGPAFFWTMPIILLGQFLVCLVFAEASSSFPIAGGVYQWARRIGGPRWGVLTAWIYTLGLVGSVAGTAASGGSFIAALFGVQATQAFTTWAGLGIGAVAILMNISGTRLLAKATELGVWAGMVGLLLCGVYMLIFARVQPWSVLFETFGTAKHGFAGAMLAASLIGVWIFYGFEACGDLAEEVEGASRIVPRAMILTVICGGISALLITLGILLAIPDMANAVNGTTADPITPALTHSTGIIGAKVALASLIICITSGTASILASTSRMLFALGRDQVILGSAFFSRMNRREQPMNSILSVSFIAVAIMAIGFISANAVTDIISFATTGIYTAFQMVVLAALIAGLRGWRPSGLFSMGKIAPFVRLVALIYGVVTITNLVWPRVTGSGGIQDYLIIISMAIIVVVGIVQIIVMDPAKKLGPKAIAN
jgi:amino acid transporter